MCVLILSINLSMHRTLETNIIPIGNSRGYEKLGIPSHAYINILDFESVEDFAQYLQYLNSNDTAYNEYFR